MFVCCACRVLSGTSLCNELITLPDESYRLWCILECYLETSWMRRPWPTWGCCAKLKNIYIYCFPSWSNINTLCAMVYYKRFSVSRVDHWVQKFGHLWATGRITWVLSLSQNWLWGFPSLIPNTLTLRSHHAA
jgi:hypothetical protein